MAAHRLDVQGLRALAIVSVLLFHFYPQSFPNGYLGVDVFFIISGYLIFTIFSRNVEKNGLNWNTISDFYFRRLARIVPLNMVYICFAVLAYCYMAPSHIIMKSQISAWRALLFMTNIFVVIEKDDYFERLLDENLFTHTWSLAVEVQYYLVVPIFFLINDRIFGKSRFFYPIVVIASFALFLLSSPQFSFNMMPTRLWQFLFITFFAERIFYEKDDALDDVKILLAESDNIRAHESQMDTLFTYAVYCSSFMLLVPFLPFGLHINTMRFFVSFCTALIIVYGDKMKNPVLSNPLSVFVGDISYSLYLFHWPFSVYLGSSFSSIDNNWGIPLSFATTFVVYHAFEKPYRKWKKNVVCKVVLIASFVLCFLSAFLILYSYQLNQAMQKGTSIEKEAATKENELMFSSTKVVYDIHSRCNYSKWKNVSFIPPDTPYGRCIMPKGEGKLKFLVIGNSFAANQGDLVYDAFKPFFSEFTLFSMTGCEVFSRSHNEYCKYPFEFKDVVSEIKPDVVFVIQRYFVPLSPLPSSGENDKIYEEMEHHLDLISNMSNLFFVEDSLPSANVEHIRRLNTMIREGRDAASINSVCLNYKDNVFARTRTKKLMEHCGNGQVMAVDEDSWLAIFEVGSHLTRYGMKKATPIYRPVHLHFYL